MRVLVTGASGFAGQHLARELLAHGHEVVAFDLEPVETAGDLTAVQGDIRIRAEVAECVKKAHPDACIHLAALAFVPDGDRNPLPMLDVNVCGTLHVLNALRDTAPACRCLVVSSSRVYGNVAGPVTEASPLLPAELYGISKVAAESAALGYAQHHGVPVIVARPGNHIGPGQSPRFVVPAFASQLKAISVDRADPVLRVGNLDSVRDFTDVRDIVSAYRMLVEGGSPGEIYNIASEAQFPVREILQKLCAIAGVTPDIQVDEARFRPTDRSPRIDTTKLASLAGWLPRITLEQSLRDIYEAV